MDAWKKTLATVPKEENLEERRRFNDVARQLRHDAFPVEKTYRLAGGGVLPEAVGLLQALEKEMKALFATLKKGSTTHQVHLKEVLRLRGLLRKDPAVQELQANPNATKGVFEGLFERGKQSLYGMFRTMYRYRWTGLKVATLALIAYLAWTYFASPGTAAIVAPSNALVPSSKGLVPSSKGLVPSSKGLVPVGSVRSSIPDADVRGISLSRGDVARAAREGETQRFAPPTEVTDLGELEHGRTGFTIDIENADTMGSTGTVRLRKLNPPKEDNVRIVSDFTRRTPHYKNEYMEIWGRGDAKPQYDFDFVPPKKGDYDITIFPRTEEEYLVAGGKMTENERYLVHAFSAEAEGNVRQRKSLVAWARALLIVVRKTRYEERFEDDNMRIWAVDNAFSMKKRRKPTKRDRKNKTPMSKHLPDVATAKSFFKTENALGVPGKEGTTYRMQWNGNDYAVKTFKKRKSGRMIAREAGFQRLAAEYGVAPHVILVDQKEKFIVMERVAMRLIDFMRQRNVSTLSEKHQAQLIEAMKVLDKVGLLHNDGNMLNLMVDRTGNLKIIDYGMAKKIDRKMRQKYKSPNGHVTLPALRRSMKHHNIKSGHIVDAYIETVKKK